MKNSAFISVENKSVQNFKVTLDPNQTNGYDRCELIVDEEERRFIAILSNGEIYSLRLDTSDEDFVSFLISVFETENDSLYSMLTDASRDNNYIDVENTINLMNKKVRQSLLDDEISTVIAGFAFDEIKQLEEFGGKTMSLNTFYSVFDTHGIEGVFPKGDTSYLSRKVDHKRSFFCYLIAPALAEALKLKYATAM